MIKWFTADLHLGHARIIELADRPFDSDWSDKEPVFVVQPGHSSKSQCYDADGVWVPAGNNIQERRKLPDGSYYWETLWTATGWHKINDLFYETLRRVSE